MFRLFLISSFLLVFGCENNSENPKIVDSKISSEFRDYWYSGKAEITKFKLEQVRYGEIHQGNAVLIFVTEDFLEDAQVKYEGGEVEDDIRSVLKLNFTRKFNTGIYPYSIMSSIFTPVDSPENTYKVSTSTQEWCGQTFSQVNNRDGDFEVKFYSYFMDEGDREFPLESGLLEDAIWNMIRLEPDNLPKGNIQIIPGTQFIRLKHRPLQLENASATLTTLTDSAGSNLKQYIIDYKDIPRKFSINFKPDFPYEIVAWEETVGGYGGDNILTTKATRTHSIKEPYWELNSVGDSIYRQKLGLN